jgi:ubiquitin carboxyl-terminal hydrolase 14
LFQAIIGHFFSKSTKILILWFSFQEYEDFIIEEGSKSKGLSKEKALQKDREEIETKEVQPFSFENDPGSNNSGYYELQAILTHKV